VPYGDDVAIVSLRKAVDLGVYGDDVTLASDAAVDDVVYATLPDDLDLRCAEVGAAATVVVLATDLVGLLSRLLKLSCVRDTVESVGRLGGTDCFIEPLLLARDKEGLAPPPPPFLSCWFSIFFCCNAKPLGALVFVDVRADTRDDACGVYGDDATICWCGGGVFTDDGKRAGGAGLNVGAGVEDEVEVGE